MTFDQSYFDKNPVTARRRPAGPTVSTGTESRGTQVAAKPERNPVTRFGSLVANTFRSAVPQGVRNAIGAGVKAVDTPLATRFGVRVPDRPGPVDEIGNVLLQELTRPTNALVALGGAGAAAR
ncbi:MAG: hypothetical protein NUV34_01830, partial [Sulfuricaulis sp.]|nr:hypothetical protein [Sulfuricaulis sp.]